VPRDRREADRERLGQLGHRRLALDEAIRQLVAAGLVEELRINLIPVIVGGGIPLFGQELPRSNWNLAAATRLATGALTLEYTRR
jgi:dihydrofolate reductase